MFQSLNRAYKRSDSLINQVVVIDAIVSIPQSGLQAFRRPLDQELDAVPLQFQSLNRAYKRSDNMIYHGATTYQVRFNPSIGLTSVPTSQSLLGSVFGEAVSIPQSGLKAFPQQATFERCLIQTVSIPQSGLQAFRQRRARKLSAPGHQFQSLNRAYKRSDQV